MSLRLILCLLGIAILTEAATTENDTPEIEALARKELVVSERSSGTVAFSAYMTSPRQMNAVQWIKCNKVKFNIGGAYDSGSGQFNVPKDGVYLIMFHMYGYKNPWVSLRNHGTRLTYFGATNGNSISETRIFKLKAGDGIQPRLELGQAFGSDHTAFTSFSGILLA